MIEEEQQDIPEKPEKKDYIALLLVVFVFVATFSGMIYLKYEDANDLSIVSWNLDNLKVNDYKDPKIMNEIVYFVQNYDIVVLQGIKNFYENNDSLCALNSFAPQTEEYKLVENNFRERLPSVYNISMSEYIGDQRYMFIWDTRKVKSNFTQILFEGNQRDANMSMCTTNNTGNMLRDPYLGYFETKNVNFSIININLQENFNYSVWETQYVDRIMKALYGNFDFVQYAPAFVVGTMNYMCPSDLRGYFLGYDGSVNTTIIPFLEPYSSLKYRWLFNESICPKSNMIFEEHFVRRIAEGGLVEDYPNLAVDVTDNVPVYVVLKKTER